MFFPPLHKEALDSRRDKYVVPLGVDRYLHALTVIPAAPTKFLGDPIIFQLSQVSKATIYVRCFHRAYKEVFKIPYYFGELAFNFQPKSPWLK